MNVGSLFSGIGGLDLGLEPTFGPPAWLCEFDRNARAVLERRFPDVPIYPDVREIDESAGPVDVLHGGYPCQPFSVAGLRGGENDPRHLWPEFARLIRVLRPRVVVAENVAGHLVLGFDRVLADLAEMGFDARWGTVRASDVGAPHRRERLFVVATDRDRGGWGERDRGRCGESGREDAKGGSTTDAERRARLSNPGSGDVPRSTREDSARAEGRAPSGERFRSDALDAGTAPADAGGERSYGAGGSDEMGSTGRGGNGRASAPGSRVPPPDTGGAGREGEERLEGSRAGRSDGQGGPASDASSEPGQPGSRRGASSGADARTGAEERDRDGLARTAERGQTVSSPPDADGWGCGVVGLEEPRRLEGSRGSQPDGCDPDGRLSDASTWGSYALAIERWERTIGRRAPRPTDDRGRLSPEFVEWMMGLPEGWTDGEKRTARLKMLGNAVVPAQAALAMKILA